MRTINQNLIAERLNLSRTTVSRSLANHPAISAETRAKVRELAAEIGYRRSPKRNVRRSRQGKPVTIGVLIGVPAANVALATFPFILQGIRERAEIEHVVVDVFFQDPGALKDAESKQQAVFRNIRSKDWRGTILIYPFPEPVVDTIARKISTVAVLESYDSPFVDTIDTDDVAGIVALENRLVKAGHRRIGFVSWDYPVGGHWCTRRFGGYVEALFADGLDFNPDWVCNVHKNSPKLSHPEIADFVAARVRKDRVSAWVCAADHQAYQLIGDLHARGIRVPRDCSVTGFDGLEPPPRMHPVASMRVAHEDIGQSAVARLLSRIMHPTAPRRKILVEAQPVEGETIAEVGSAEAAVPSR